jgi:hypothetical protein
LRYSYSRFLSLFYQVVSYHKNKKERSLRGGYNNSAFCISL